jgi:hypothetical protein
LRCGENVTDCAVKHVVPLLDGTCRRSRRIGGKDIPFQWAATCPVCGVANKLTLTIEHGKLLRHCQRCKAPQAKLTGALAELIPSCFGGRRPRQIEPDDLIALALTSMPPVSMKLAMLEMAGLSTPAALEKLGIRRENRSRVINGRRIRTDAKPQVAARIETDDMPEAS